MNQDLTWDLAAQVALAHGEDRPLRIQGGGTKTWLGRVVDGEPLVVGGHRGILSYEPTELVITARAGTPLAEIEAALAERGQWLAFEPPHFSMLHPSQSQFSTSHVSAGHIGFGHISFGHISAGPISSADSQGASQGASPLPADPKGPPGVATLGGTIACGLSGPARPYAGAARDFVLGVRLINGKGEVLRFGGEVMKNVAGYDLSRLMAGAQGTLGVLLDVSLKVLPRPAVELTLVFDLPPAEAIRRFNQWAGQPLPLSAACHDGERAYVRLGGNEAAVRAAHARLGGDVLGAQAPAGEDRDAADFWRAVRELGHPFFLQGMTNRQGMTSQLGIADQKGMANQEKLANQNGIAFLSGTASHQEAANHPQTANQPGTAPLWRLSLPPTAPHDPRLGPQFIDWGGALRWVHSQQPLWPVAQAAGGHASCYGLAFAWRNARTAGNVAPGTPATPGSGAGSEAGTGAGSGAESVPGSNQRVEWATGAGFQPLPPALLALHRRLKVALDPRGILNPGRLYPEL